eukprot:gene18874-6627_t
MSTELVPNQLGVLVLDRTGKIISATGELAGQTSIAKVMSTEGKAEPFRRMTITFESVQYRVAITADTHQITVVKCPNVPN